MPQVVSDKTHHACTLPQPPLTALQHWHMFAVHISTGWVALSRIKSSCLGSITQPIATALLEDVADAYVADVAYAYMATSIDDPLTRAPQASDSPGLGQTFKLWPPMGTKVSLSWPNGCHGHPAGLRGGGQCNINATQPKAWTDLSIMTLLETMRICQPHGKATSIARC